MWTSHDGRSWTSATVVDRPPMGANEGEEVSAIAGSVLSRERQASTTRAPRRASSRAVTKPMPVFAPVMTAVRPFRSMAGRMLHWVGVNERLRRWALGGFAALVIAALVGLLWWARASQGPGSAGERSRAEREGSQPGDGDDPRYDQRGPRRERLPCKTLQLCGQVARTLEAVLAEQAEDALRNLHVVSVQPAPDESRLLVTLGPLVPGTRLEVEAVLIALDSASGRLRQEVAAAITRRRTPTLAFQVQ